MKFELEVGQGADESSPIKVRFSLRKSTDGSIGLMIRNEAFEPSSDVEILRIQTNGVIRRNAFDAGVRSRSFMQYENRSGSAFVQFE